MKVCYEKFTQGTLVQDPNQARINKVSPNVADHKFYAYAEAGSFKGLVAGPKSTGQTQKQKKKEKPNGKFHIFNIIFQ